MSQGPSEEVLSDEKQAAQQRLGYLPRHLPFRGISKVKGGVCKGAVKGGQTAWHILETLRK